MAAADENRVNLLFTAQGLLAASAHRPVGLDVLDYFTAARNDTCPEEKNAPKWG